MSKMMKFLAGLVMGAVLALPALAQSTVVTLPSARTTTNASSTIAVTDTFQSIWTSQTNRVSCGIQNNSANSMWVYFGPIASATKPTSVLLASGEYLNCSTSGVVATNQVSITGTSGGVFYAALDGAPIVSGAGVAGGGGGAASDVNLVETGSNVLANDDAAAGTTTPVPVGGIYNSTAPAYTAGDRTQLQVGPGGELLTGPRLLASTQGDNSTNDPTVIRGMDISGVINSVYNVTLPKYFDGATWDRVRGDSVGGAWVQGNVASGVADTGNPVKVGCIVETGTLPTYADAVRGDCIIGSRGSMSVTLYGGNSSQPAVIGTPADGTSPVGAMQTNSFNSVFNGTNWDRARGTTQGTWSNLSGSSDAGVAISSGVTAVAASSVVAKASAGNFYGANLTTGASAGYFLLFDATSAPADGVVTPARCWSVAATSSLSVEANPPVRMATGITMVFSTTGCFTKTASATGFMAVDYE